MTDTQSFNCIFCKEIFDNKEDLQVHFRKHGDPSFNIKNRFEIPTQTSNDKSKEKEMVRCDVCTQAFPTISKAITHKHKVHPDHDAKYFCPWCGKLFTMKHLYNIHVENTHKCDVKPEDTGFHCDTCDVSFFVPSAVNYHNKFFHRQDTDIPDIGFSKKIKSINQEVIQIYYCAFCGEEYDNKVNLYKHITDDHSDENQSPQEVLRCPICEAVFYHLDAYEVHLTFHSTEDTYNAKNPLFEELTDFSLESVPPIMETVEGLEPEVAIEQADPIAEANAMGIEQFLELAMNPSDDSNSVKVKKHKKHKKSKKSAITLDEFLSMNTDVFGEDLDIQGVEEIPTQVVKRHFKTNNKNQVQHMKAVNAAELAKLKKQGIVIKKSKTLNPLVTGLKPVKPIKFLQAQNKVNNEFNPDKEIKTSNEMLSKLINQSNNQIKIVKKSSAVAINNSDEVNEGMGTCDKNGASTDECNAVNKKDTEEPNNSEFESYEENSSPKPQFSSSPVSEKQLTINKNAKIIHSNDIEIDKQIKSNETNSDKSMKVIECPKKLNISEECINDRLELMDPGQQAIEKDKFVEVHMEQNNKINDSMAETSNDNKLQTKVTTTNEPLSHLKHLSHLITVKSVNQNKNSNVSEKSQPTDIESKNDTNLNKNDHDEATRLLADKDNKVTTPNQQNLSKEDPTLNALKNLNKNLIIKSLSNKKNAEETEYGSDNVTEEQMIPTKSFKMVNEAMCNKNVTIKKIKLENDPDFSDQFINSSTSQTKLIQPGTVLQKTNKSTVEPPVKPIMELDNSTKKVTDDILKRFPNITTKPITPKKELSSENQAEEKVQKHMNEESKSKTEEIIEIFDIDDSDEESEAKINQPQVRNVKVPEKNTKPVPVTRKTQVTNIKKPLESNHNTLKSVNPLKNLSKHITVKPIPQHMAAKKTENDTTVEEQFDDDPEGFMDDFDDDDDDVPIARQNAKIMNIKHCSQKFSNRNVTINRTLNNLSKNITVKSNDSSPSQCLRAKDHTQDNFEENEESNSDTSQVNVKITELEGDVSDNELNTDDIELSNKTTQPIVESPNDSENEQSDEIDFESEILANTVKNNSQNANQDTKTAFINNLKNINRNLTIKSVNSNSQSATSVQDSQATAQQKKIQNTSKQIKQLVKESQFVNMTPNKNIKMMSHAVEQSANRSINQKVSVNKEVTMKTVQTKTVIQEITTTVTKTIKTVNQSVQQEVRNACQTNQKIIGMKPSPSKNLQGVVVKHASPHVAPIRFNNTVAQVRPVRPSNQMVPVRPGLNVVRPSANVARPSRPRMPRMPAANNVLPPNNTHKQMIGKALKISPNAMSSKITKRPNAEEVSGPFSCFKKPKESLIPVADIPNFSGDTTAQFAATSQVSTSNITSTTKVVKGNSVVTATQMKSEMNASCQQISKSNVIGLKVNMSQTNQCQVQEKSETSAMKRTTLEAIQKLQKQGLLIKKPRVENEVSADAERSDEDLDL